MISIIDGDESVRLSLASLVRSLGADTRTFASAQSFLSSDAPGQSACVVSDVEMPQLSVIDVQLMLNRRAYSIPVIFIMAFRSDSTSEGSIPNGAYCYLEKPVDAQTFENALNQVLGPDWAAEHRPGSGSHTSNRVP